MKRLLQSSRGILAGVLSMLLEILAPNPATAALVTYSFEGTLLQIDAPLSGIWSAGQAFSGYCSFESSTGDSIALSGMEALYERSLRISEL